MPLKKSARCLPDEVPRQPSFSNRLVPRSSLCPNASDPQIEIISDESRFNALEPVWNQLLQQSSSDVVFLTFEWLSTWWQSFASGHQLFIVVAKKDDTIVGLAPLMIRNREGFRELVPIGGRTSDYKDLILIDKKNQEAILEAMVRAILEERTWDFFRLDGIREDSPNLASLTGILSNHFPETSPSCHEMDISPYIQIDQAWEDYWEGLKGSWLSSHQRKTRLLKKERGEVVFQKPADANEVSLYMEKFIKLHRIRRMEVSHTPSMFEQPAMVSFYTKLARRMFERKWLNLPVLLVNGEVAAIHFGFEYAGKYLYYLPAFSHSFQRYSVGSSLLIYMVNDSFVRGFKEFDLLLGNESYKFHFKPKVRKLYSVTFLHRSLRGRAANIWFRKVRPRLEVIVNRSTRVQQVQAWFRKVRS